MSSLLSPALSALLGLHAAAKGLACSGTKGQDIGAACLAGCAGIDPGRLAAVAASIVKGLDVEDADLVSKRVTELADEVSAMAVVRTLSDDEVSPASLRHDILLIIEIGL